MESSIDRPPLVVRFGAFGDMVLVTILLRHLYERFGKRVDVISSGPWTAPLLDGQPWMGRLFVIRSRRTPYLLSLDQWRLVSWLRERGAGPTWYCDRDDLGINLLKRGGVPSDYICDARAFPWIPEEGFADRYIRLGNESPPAFAGSLPPVRPGSSRAAHLVLSDAVRSEARDWLARRDLTDRPYIVVHPGSRHIARRTIRSRVGAEKYWPEDRWAQVLRSLSDLRPDHALLLTGTRAERKFNDAIASRLGLAQIKNVADELPTRTLLPVLERAQSMVSVDTGPAHAAAALGTPTVALFGPASPILFRPGGATTPAIAVTGRVNGAQSIQGIAPEAVISAWLELIRSTEAPANHSVNSLSLD
jgi:heptosyltransferase-2/heptosyltransferase-3